MIQIITIMIVVALLTMTYAKINAVIMTVKMSIDYAIRIGVGYSSEEVALTDEDGNNETECIEKRVQLSLFCLALTIVWVEILK